jgi:hypothetical protein
MTTEKLDNYTRDEFEINGPEGTKLKMRMPVHNSNREWLLADAKRLIIEPEKARSRERALKEVQRWSRELAADGLENVPDEILILLVNEVYGT